MSRELLNKIIEWRNTKFSTLTDLDLLLDEAIEIEKQSPDPVMYIGELAFNELKKGWCGDVYCTNYEIGPNDVPLYAEQPARKPLTDDEIDEFCSEMPEQVKDVFKMGVRFAEDRIHGIRDYLNGQITHGITDPEQSKPQSNAI
jgi:hypothetical protein